MKPSSKFIIPLFFNTVCLCSCINSHYFKAVQSGDGIEIFEKGKKVLFYQERPKSLNGKYERAGYIHPLYSLNEKSLTEDFPADHPYHRGIFWAWHQVILGNKKIADGWTCDNISWVPTNVKLSKTREYITLSADVLWKSKLEHKGVTDIIKENTKISIYKSTSQYRVLDFDIKLFALIDSLKIGGSDDAKSYGGFCLRLRLPDDILFVSKGVSVTPQETPVYAGPWMDFTGSFEGAASHRSGLTVFCYPPDHGQSQQWILRKKESMQNIVFPGRTPIELSKNGLNLRYRVVIHNNEISNSGLDSLYNEYIKNEKEISSN